MIAINLLAGGVAYVNWDHIESIEQGTWGCTIRTVSGLAYSTAESADVVLSKDVI